MNSDGTSLDAYPKDKGATSSEAKSFTSVDLERVLAKQKEEHDASVEGLVQMRLATLTTMLAPLSGGTASRPLCLLLHLVNNLLAVITPVFHGFMQDLKCRNQSITLKANLLYLMTLLFLLCGELLCRIIFDMEMMRCWRSWSMVINL